MNHVVAAGDAGERSAPSRGLHRTRGFRDNCCFGLIAYLEGEVSHRLLQTAIESLTCMTPAAVLRPMAALVIAVVSCCRCAILLGGMRPRGCSTLTWESTTLVGMLFPSRDEALQQASRETAAVSKQMWSQRTSEKEAFVHI